jgi:3-phosphoshikimate 1-carboxyvinyltransferase
MILTPSDRPFRGEVDLPISKSIANRYLTISAIAGKTFSLPDGLPQDVQVLKDALNSASAEVNVGMAGTAMRFLTAFYAIQNNKETILIGDYRMSQRPISELVNALKELGADISCVKQEGYPPLRIRGKELTGEEVSVSGSVSSQFVSALMMIAATMKDGLKIKLTGSVLSKSYIELTAKCMSKSGVNVMFENDVISIPSAEYQLPSLQIESDWSAASYFYAMACTKPKSRLLLKGLKLNSDQGDSIVSKWFEPLGVSSVQKENGVEISSSGTISFPSTVGFKNNPDLAQMFAFLAATLGEKLELTGLDNLRIKETDRIAALKTELEKLGVSVMVDGNSMTVSGKVSIQKNSDFHL